LNPNTSPKLLNQFFPPFRRVYLRETVALEVEGKQRAHFISIRLNTITFTIQ
jgi:hypothetical protein